MKSVQDAIDAIADEHPLAEDRDADVSVSFQVGDQANPAALYSDASGALKAFVREALATLTGQDGEILFVDGPHLDRWEITIKGTTMAHRVAEARYSVCATIGVVE